jgi:putative membrane-bound dehydrogenase-like protein
MTTVLLLALLAAQEPQTPEETVRGMKLPDGFSVTLFAGEPDVVQPVGFCIDDRGRLWVAEMLSYPKWQARDRIVVFEDTDGDGKFDKRTVFIEGLTYVTGIEVGFGGVWVMAPPKMLFIPDRDGDLRPDGPPEVLLDGFGLHGGHNIANGFTWGPDGWLYAGHGRTSISDVGKPGCRPDERIHFDGGVFRYHPTRHVFEPWCDGTTNPWGVAFDDHGQMFICTCVDVHLYHAIQGGKFEPWRGRESSRFAYKRIPSIADHKHWAGASIDGSRGGKADTLAAGGGHAHCGMMCYLGDTFPESYRGTLFMNNIHGHRVNNDLPKRVGSGFTATHGADFMVSSDPMHMGLLLQYGPDGGVFVSDWYDRGECHTRQPSEGTGRIYKITYKDTPRVQVDLAKLSDDELVRLQLHKNDWYVTHARRLLQERGPNPKVHEALLKIFEENPDVTRRLRAMWALHATGGLTDERRRKALSDPEEYVRAWAIQLEMERHSAPLPRFVEMSKVDPSPVVRLYLASACPRMTLKDRWEIIRGLASHGEDAVDPNLPLMTWYAAEPMAEEDARLALAFVAEAKIPLLRQFMVRRLAGVAPSSAAGAEGLAGTIAFSSNAPRSWGLYVLDRETQKVTRLTDSPALDYGAVFSPDGQRIAFVSDRDGNSELYTVRPDGSDLKRITNDPSLDNHPSWSPDSQQILFASTRVPASEPGRSWSALYLMRADGKGVERMSPRDASDFSPCWSWWGDLVAFASGTGKAGSTDLYTMKPDGSDRKLVIKDGGWPTFAAGSRTIYFHSKRDGSWGIWKVNADGSSLSRITPKEVEVFTPRATRSNLMVVATKRREGPREIEIVDLDTREMKALLHDRSDHFQPCLSPDGRYVAYHRSVPEAPVPNVERRGTAAPGLTLLRVEGWSPALSPDGQRLAVLGKDLKQIDLVNCDGSNRTTAYTTKNPGSLTSLFWLPLGNEFAFVEDGNLRIVQPGAGGGRTVEGNREIFRASLSPDGNEFVYSGSSGGGLSVRKTTGRDVRKLTEGLAFDNHPDWSPTGEWIAFTRSDRPEERQGIWLIKPDGTGLRRLISAAGHPCFSPDGQWVAFLSAFSGLSVEDGEQLPQHEVSNEVFAVRVDGTGLIRLTHSGFLVSSMVWGPPVPAAKGNGGR